jgi:hypothetical protein
MLEMVLHHVTADPPRDPTKQQSDVIDNQRAREFARVLEGQRGSGVLAPVGVFDSLVTYDNLLRVLGRVSADEVDAPIVTEF